MEVTREIVFPDSPAEVWKALTEAEQLEEWFANDVELDPREGGDGVFRWDDGEERRAKVLVAEPGERLVLDWDDQGEVEYQSLAGLRHEDLRAALLAVVPAEDAVLAFAWIERDVVREPLLERLGLGECRT